MSGSAMFDELDPILCMARDKRAFIWRLEGLKSKEVGQRLGISAGRVYHLVDRFHRRFGVYQKWCDCEQMWLYRKEEPIAGPLSPEDARKAFKHMAMAFI